MSSNQGQDISRAPPAKHLSWLLVCSLLRCNDFTLLLWPLTGASHSPQIDSIGWGHCISPRVQSRASIHCVFSSYSLWNLEYPCARYPVLFNSFKFALMKTSTQAPDTGRDSNMFLPQSLQKWPFIRWVTHDCFFKYHICASAGGFMIHYSNTS